MTRTGLLSLGILLTACVEPEVPTASSTDPTPAECSDTCGVVNVDGTSVHCGPCVEGEELEELMAPVDELIDVLWDRSYMQELLPLDRQEIRSHAASAFEDDPNARRARLSALNRAMRAFRNGHSGVYLTDSDCRSRAGADLDTTPYGVCAAPVGDDGFVVSHQPGTDNPLGLQPGEAIVAVDGLSGHALIQSLLDGPLCGNGAGNATVDHAHAAAALFASLRRDDVLTVRALDGTEREVVVPDRGGYYPAACRFPAGPSAAPLITVTQRSDGVVVAQVPRFILYPGEPGFVDPTTTAGAVQLQDAMVTQIADALEPVLPDATGIIWDVRGNFGGVSLVGLVIASGMPGAQPGLPIAHCSYRRPGDGPIVYESVGSYVLPDDDRLAIDLPAAVLIDSMSISAADHFARAVDIGTDARLFGRPTAGTWGGGGAATVLESDDEIRLGYDPYRCDDDDGEALETRSVEPHEWVDLDPEDLAAGTDTVLERAAEWVRTQ